MKCRLMQFITLLSLLLSIGFAGLWVRSRYAGDILSWRPGTAPRTYHIFHSRGDLAMSRMDNGGYDVSEGGWRRWNQDPYAMYTSWAGRASCYRLLGFATQGPVPSAPGGAVLIPYWFLITLTAMPPLLVGVRMWRRRSQTNAGLCRVCGYDLRATPHRCPECGNVPCRTEPVPKAGLA